MTATEQLKTNAKYLDRLNHFLTEDEVGVLFNKSITEKVLQMVPVTHDQSNHGTIFYSGRSAGATQIRSFIDDFDPLAVAETLRKKAADAKITAPLRLPSQIAAEAARREQHK
jgi:hypothetical protein